MLDSRKDSYDVRMQKEAERKRQYKARKRSGNAVFEFEAHEYTFLHWLIEAGRLKEWQADDAAAVRAATSKFMKEIMDENPERYRDDDDTTED